MLDDAGGGGELGCPDHPAVVEMDPQEDWDSGRIGGEVARKFTGRQATPCGGFAGGSQRQAMGGDPERAPEQGAGEPGT